MRSLTLLFLLTACATPSEEVADRAPTYLQAGAPLAGVAEAPIDFPVGSPLGGFSSRCSYIGNDGNIDRRQSAYTVAFSTSVGAQTRSMAKVLWLENGDQHFVLFKADVIYSFDGLVEALEDRLGEATGLDLQGRVVVATSHSHNTPANFSDQLPFYLGGDRYNEETFERMALTLETIALDAYDSRTEAAIGMGIAEDWDPDDQVYSDRRPENDDLQIWDDTPAGRQKDPHLWLLRVDDAQTGAPMGMFFTFGIHGTVLGSDNAMISTDSSGHIELAVQEQFDTPVVVAHLQGSGGDAAPVSDAAQGHSYARLEGLGLRAVDGVMALWEDTPVSTDAFTMESVSHAYEQNLEAVTVTRDGAVDWRYAPYVDEEGFTPDNQIYGSDGEILSPIDEFNAQYGGIFCGYDDPLINAGTIGASVFPYDGCIQIELISFIMSGIFSLESFDGTLDPPMPLPSSTRAFTNATRLGPISIREPDGSTTTDDFLFAFFPGETTAMFNEQFRRRAAAELGMEHTMAVGYAQDHEGYLLLPEDWLRGGYETNINMWGPLQGEHLIEGVLHSAEEHLLTERLEPQDASGAYQTTQYKDRPLPTDAPDETPSAGTQPSQLPEYVYTPFEKDLVVQLQPDAELPRGQGIAQLTWEGGDPGVDTPTVVLEREVDGAWQEVLTPSGRPITDTLPDILVTHTPDPLYPYTDAQTHTWWAGWQAVGHGEDRLGLAEGTYRLHVYGDTYTGGAETWPWPSAAYEITSDPFVVVPAVVSVSVDETGVSAWLEGPVWGYRLLDAAGASQGSNPLRAATVTWILDDGGSITETLAGDDVGAVTRFEGAVPPEGAVAVLVEDMYGNYGQVEL